MSTSALKTQLYSLHCGTCVVDYMTDWHAGVAQLNDSSYPFMV